MRLILSLFAGLLLVACSGQPVAAPTISVDDFRPLVGEEWSGELTYLNYNSDERSTIPVRYRVIEDAPGELKFKIAYPGEESHNATNTIAIGEGGTTLFGAPVISRTQTDDGLEIVTLTDGEDGNKPAKIRIIYRISASDFSMEKRVRFGGENEFRRNIYEFGR